MVNSITALSIERTPYVCAEPCSTNIFFCMNAKGDKLQKSITPAPCKLMSDKYQPTGASPKCTGMRTPLGVMIVVASRRGLPGSSAPRNTNTIVPPPSTVTTAKDPGASESRSCTEACLEPSAPANTNPKLFEKLTMRRNWRVLLSGWPTLSNMAGTAFVRSVRATPGNVGWPPAHKICPMRRRYSMPSLQPLLLLFASCVFKSRAVLVPVFFVLMTLSLRPAARAASSRSSTKRGASG